MNNSLPTARNISELPNIYCYGCGVCVNVCPTKCIKMVDDHEGFPYPQVDEAHCISCKKCVLDCPGFNEYKNKRQLSDPLFFGGYVQDDRVRFTSSSGGFFTPIAEKIFAAGGVVYGAIYDFDQMTVKHSRAETEIELAPMRKSKYVQSQTADILHQVRKDLLANIPVLFTGTPCQVEGLYLFLERDYPNLLTCDIICHGVPSPGLFQRHFRYLEQKHQSKINKIDFRTKEKGWGGPQNLFLDLGFDASKKLTHSLFDPYYALFLANLSLRPCCFHCKYASTNRRSDITLGDFWGVSKKHPELFDHKGTSLVLINTKKGMEVLESISPSVEIAPIQDVDPFPPNLAKPSHRPRYRDRFFNKISLKDWKKHRLKAHLIAVFSIVKYKVSGLIKNLQKN